MVPRTRLRVMRRAAAWLALAAAGAAAGCVHDVHRIGTPAPPTPERASEVRVLVFGDFGLRTPQQWLAARAMRRESRARPFDLGIQVGDNLYFCGPNPLRPGAETCRFSEDDATVAAGATPPDDPIFLVNEGPLAGLVGRDGAPLPMFLALGNHDVASGGRCAVPGLSEQDAARRRACLSVARRTETWTMPARHYVVDRGPVRLVVVDTNVAVADYGGFTLEEELGFVREATAACGPGRICFLVGHHPPALVLRSGWGRVPSYAPRMARLVAAAGGRARAFFAGHIHTLEHLSAGPLDVFVSGSTAMGAAGHGFRWVWPPDAQVRFVTSTWGYAVLEADVEGYRVRFTDLSGEPLYCCEAGSTGPCRPVTCG